MSEGQLAMISEWMANGSINEFVKANPDANRLKLVGLSLEISLYALHLMLTDTITK